MPLFCIIVPVFNGREWLGRCIDSIAYADCEILIVDDCSTDATAKIIQALASKYPNVKALRTKQNAGPGEARNVGLDHASGEWIVFLDSDDALAPGAFDELATYIRADKEGCDCIGYNWTYDASSSAESGRKGGRYDFKSLGKPKPEMLKDCLSLGTDGSVIYTAMRRSMLEEHKLRFFGGMHEDVDFIFKVYWYARRIGIIDKILYVKNNRKGSIVNTMSGRHLEGYFRAYAEILHMLQEAHALEAYGKAYYTGLIGIVATRVRDILRLADAEANLLLGVLYMHWLAASSRLSIPRPKLQTKYGMIADRFLEIMQSDASHAAAQLRPFMDDIAKKSWSCYDLHNSVFLAQNEVRTCCKRFFVDGKMKGDVIIASLPKDGGKGISAQTILQGKKDLYTEINRGESAACGGCPFMEFREWGYIEDLKLEHLSLEYHSVCNLQCTYCSETYYGGKKPVYDVKELVEGMFDSGALSTVKSVVWGGGEPALGPHFDDIIDMVGTKLPNVKQRVLSNSIKFAPKIEALLKSGQANLLTSVDAGTPETFTAVRGRSGFRLVFKNLKKYAAAAHNKEDVIIKYIFTDGNTDYSEVGGYVDAVKEHDLTSCAFQISCDFKKEKIDMHTAVAAALMYGLLLRAGVKVVYFDELLRQRMMSDFDEADAEIRNELLKWNLSDIIADKNAYESVILFGAGQQTKLLLDHAAFFRKVKVDHIVDSTPSKIGTTFMGYEVRDPATLKNSNLPVLISAVQNSARIYEKYREMGLPDSRLVRGLVL